jgi:hypothetical protein
MKVRRVKPPGDHEIEKALLNQFIVKKQTQVITLQKVIIIQNTFFGSCFERNSSNACIKMKFNRRLKLLVEF